MKLNPRAMLARYLRATGWAVVPRGAYPNDPMWYRSATAECIVGTNGGVPSIYDAAPFYDVTPAEMAMRLGLCVSAEYHARHKSAAEEVIARSTDTIEAFNAHQIALVARDNHNHLMREMLQMAGVDSAQWEAAR